MNKKIPAGVAALVLAAGAVFIIDEEGMVLGGYADPIWGDQLPTECAGETGPDVVLGQSRTLEYCLQKLDKRLSANLTKLDACVEKDLRVEQWVALLSLAHNIGPGGVCASTMVKMINRGDAPAAWCRQLTHAKNRRGEEVGFTYADGVRVNGLVLRRQRERKVCETGHD